MPDIKYPKNSNSDTVFVEDGGQRTRAVKVAQPDGTIDYPKNPNSDSCYVTVDGEKQRALMVVDLSTAGTIDYPINPNSTKGYVTINGKKQRVSFTANIAGGGSAPTETINITSNGIYDVTNYASANVNVPTTAPALYREFQLDANGVLQSNTTTTHIMNFTGMTDVSDYALAKAYFNNTAISGGVDISDLTAVSGTNGCQNMFYGCTGITSADLSALATISGVSGCSSMFQNCTSLTSAILTSLTTISGNNGCSYMFYGCTGITSADLSALATISGNLGCQSMFNSCTSLTTVYIGGTTAINFGTRTNQFQNMFQGCTQNIDVYAPAANQATIEAFSGYPNFGGTGNVVWHWRS